MTHPILRIEEVSFNQFQIQMIVTCSHDDIEKGNTIIAFIQFADNSNGDPNFCLVRLSY